MSLKRLRDYSRRMAEAEHKDECPSLTAKEPYWSPWVLDEDNGGFTWRGWRKPKWERPRCDGCNPAEDRALFGQIANELNQYLGDQLVLFGDDR